jgi:hypothetical protein
VKVLEHPALQPDPTPLLFNDWVFNDWAKNASMTFFDRMCAALLLALRAYLYDSV